MMDATVEEEVRIEYMPLGEIAPWPHNPKLHDDEGIRASLKRFGFVQPAAMDESTGRLVAGHGRIDGARALRDAHIAAPADNPVPNRIKVREDGEWLVPVLRGVSFADEQEAEAYLLTDNRLTELGGWDKDELTAMLDRVATDSPFGLEGAGFTDAELDALHKEAAKNDPGKVEFPEVDEATADGKVKIIACPHCGGEVPI